MPLAAMSCSQPTYGLSLLVRSSTCSACLRLSRYVSPLPGVFSCDITVAKLAALCWAADRHVVCEQEMVECPVCSKSTRHLQYTTKFHDVTATSFAAEQHRQAGRRLGQLLQAVDVTRRSCNPDHGTATYSTDLCDLAVWQGRTFSCT